MTIQPLESTSSESTASCPFGFGIVTAERPSAALGSAPAPAAVGFRSDLARGSMPPPTRTRPEAARVDDLHPGLSELRQVETLLSQYYDDTAKNGLDGRLGLVERLAQVATEPSYTPTRDELAWLARIAWRNETRCIGRARWGSAIVRDSRHLTDADDVAADLVEHLVTATNGGRIRSVVTIYHPDVKIENEQVVGYAGHRQPDGTVIGDPAHVEMTDRAKRLGWHPGWPASRARNTVTRWDLLPLIVTGADGRIVVRDLPPEAVLQVRLHHPDFPWFARLGLRWYAVPALCSHQLQVTESVAYPSAFSGFYLSTEIACRDLADADRYDVLPTIARRLRLDTTTRRTLWEGFAENVLHQAVLDSFDAAKTRIADPAAESDLYLKFVQTEGRQGRDVHADWPWLVPPWHSARLKIYHTYQAAPDPYQLPIYRKRA